MTTAPVDRAGAWRHPATAGSRGRGDRLRRRRSGSSAAPSLAALGRRVEPGRGHARVHPGMVATGGRELAYGIWTPEGFAGAIGLHTNSDNRSAMIGYWIDEAHEGEGIVTRAARRIAELAFRDFSMHRVWLSADANNTRSCAVAERLGFRREGVHREDVIVDGAFRDTVITRSSNRSGRWHRAKARDGPRAPATASPHRRTRGRRRPGAHWPVVSHGSPSASGARPRTSRWRCPRGWGWSRGSPR